MSDIIEEVLSEEDDTDIIPSISEEQDENAPDPLEAFRSQWQQELQLQQTGKAQEAPLAQSEANGSGAPNGEEEELVEAIDTLILEPSPSVRPQYETSDEALKYFLEAIHMEEDNRVMEAMQLYRLAAKIDPHIEKRVYRMQTEGKLPTSNAKKDAKLDENEEEENALEVSDSDRTPVVEIDSVLDPKQFIVAATPTECTHLRDLPRELILKVFQLALLPELNLSSIFRLSRVCRGFYLLLRDDGVWRFAAKSIWGSLMQSNLWSNYRLMCLERPRVLFHGVYISRSTYSRQGEKNIGQYYNPVHLVEYYRYLRFFPTGDVVAVTSSEHPNVVVPRLKHPGMLPKREKLVFTGKFIFEATRVDGLVLSVKKLSDREQGRNVMFETGLRISGRKRAPSTMLCWEFHRSSLQRANEAPIYAEYELGGYTRYFFSPVRGLALDYET
eukprot:m.33041 g.33041  ORF g.33041 m.33041 type:complete len:443 (-) comp8482_c0_seq1:2104-3432(-)